MSGDVLGLALVAVVVAAFLLGFALGHGGAYDGSCYAACELRGSERHARKEHMCTCTDGHTFTSQRSLMWKETTQ